MPNQVAKRLNMSRIQLNNLLDRGEILSHTVDGERRIRMRDLLEYERRREQARRELAECFAHQDQIRSKVIDGLAKPL